MSDFDNKFQSVNEKKKFEVVNKGMSAKMTEKEIKEYIGFTKYKNRLLTIRLVKTILTTVSFAFLAGGLALILTKLEVIPISPWFSLLFMLLGGAIAFPCVFLPLSITDKNLAYKLDEEFLLKERVQTSLANMNNNSAMSVLLREDLKNVTSEISSKKIKARGLPVYIAVAAISLVVLIAGLAIKQDKPTTEQAPPPPPTDVKWELTVEQEIALEEIIKSLEESEIEEQAKAELVQMVRALIVDLKSISNESIAIERITTCVTDMDEITDKTGSRVAIYKALKSKETVFSRELARAITKQDKDSYLVKINEALDSLKHKNDMLEEPTEEQQKAMKDETLTLLRFSAEDVLLALSESGVDPSDELYKLIYTLVTLDDNGVYGITPIADMLEILKYRFASIQLDALKDTMLVQQNLYAELERQNVSYNAGYGASDGIRELFGLPTVSRVDNSKEPKPEDDEETSDDEQKPSDGGYGEGLIIAGGEIVFEEDFDHTKVTLEIYQKYEEKMLTIFGVENENGEIVLPPEMQEYLELLLNGYKEGDK